MLAKIRADTLEMVSNSLVWMRLIAAAYLVVSYSPVAVATTCEQRPPLCQQVVRAEVAFFGEVIGQTTYVEQSETGPLPQGIQAARFRVIRAFKGVEADEFWGVFYFGLSSAAKPFRQGARYLVFAKRSATGVFHAGCGDTREIFTAADQQEWSRMAVELSACIKTLP